MKCSPQIPRATGLLSSTKKAGTRIRSTSSTCADYVESIGWDKKPPAPKLPANVIKQTSEKYIEAYEKLTGKKFVR